MSAGPRYCYWQTESDGLWRFALVGANGEPQGPGQGYTRKSDVLRGIAAHRRNAMIAQVVHVSRPPSAPKAKVPKKVAAG